MSSEEDDDILPKEGEELKTRKDKYTAVKLIGKGGYGAVYQVVRKSDNKVFAVKCEKLAARKKVLPMDCRVLRGAQLIKSCHFCSIEDRGKIENRFIFLVMKLIGTNLWDLRVERESMRFTLNTSLKAAEQCLICIEELHRLGFLHRDIKPGNFAIGRPEANEHHIIYMLDFGLCRKFQEKDKDVRVPREVAPFRGTTRYAPIAAMKQIEQSRKDDLEGWMYMVVEWTSGGLPWRKYKADNREEVLKMKEEVRDKEEAMAIFFRNCPEREFKRIIKVRYSTSIPCFLTANSLMIHVLYILCIVISHQQIPALRLSLNSTQSVAPYVTIAWRTVGVDGGDRLYLYELTYFSIPDYNFIYYCIQHACKSNNIKPTDPLDWDMGHEFAGPTGPPGDGKMSDMKLDEHEEDFDGGKNVGAKHGGNSESAGRKNSKMRSTRNDAKNDKSLVKQTSRKITAPVG
ncbi:hypothetical protein Y032_0159g3297 [Ancylostoma ceylanicum]|uniref:Protein kinase domain-containing protein n=1 Tax=Ancylostoma ceylanicum TaxID=53326 RepID=A0A016SYV1_9BILA|nr:hypothetical protein Y032_0159g3297 [Ancylostoma ceylanicum]